MAQDMTNLNGLMTRRAEVYHQLNALDNPGTSVQESTVGKLGRQGSPAIATTQLPNYGPFSTGITQSLEARDYLNSRLIGKKAELAILQAALRGNKKGNWDTERRVNELIREVADLEGFNVSHGISGGQGAGVYNIPELQGPNMLQGPNVLPEQGRNTPEFIMPQGKEEYRGIPGAYQESPIILGPGNTAESLGSYSNKGVTRGMTPKEKQASESKQADFLRKFQADVILETIKNKGKWTQQDQKTFNDAVRYASKYAKDELTGGIDQQKFNEAFKWYMDNKPGSNVIDLSKGPNVDYGVEYGINDITGSPKATIKIGPKSNQISLPANIKTTSQAMAYLTSQGLTRSQAIQWIRDNAS